MEGGRWETGETTPLGRPPGIKFIHPSPKSREMPRHWVDTLVLNLFNLTMGREVEDGRWKMGDGEATGSIKFIQPRILVSNLFNIMTWY